MYKYETHLHTYPVSACAGASPEEMVRHYKKIGYAGIIVTDHFFNGNSGCPQHLKWNKKVDFFAKGYERAKKEGLVRDLDVFFGFEYSFSGTEFLVYGLSVDFLYNNPDFDLLKIEEFSAAVRAEGGYLAQAHPYRNAFWIDNPVPAPPSLMDGMEVHNAAMAESVNRRAYQFAEMNNIPMQAGTDAHDPHPRPSGIILKKRAESIFDIIEAIKSRQVELIK